MIDKLTIHNLKPLHGAFNMGVFILLVFQALLGLKIRTHRRAAAPLPGDAVRKHRRLGPVIAFCSLAGFCGGMTLAYLDHGQVLRHPFHFSLGLSIVCLLFATTLVSRRIRATTDSLRNLHFCLGIVILVLYAAQILLGLRMLLKT
jgi:hypothetical protein